MTDPAETTPRVQNFEAPLTALDDGGLDTVSLILDIEQEFQIDMPAAITAPVLTVGQLHRLVCRLTGAPVSEGCPGARAHREVREALAQAGFDRSRWRPSARTGRQGAVGLASQWDTVA